MDNHSRLTIYVWRFDDSVILYAQRNNAKKESEKGAGGGKTGMEARKGGDMHEAMKIAQDKRAEVDKKRLEKAAKT